MEKRILCYTIGGYVYYDLNDDQIERIEKGIFGDDIPRPVIRIASDEYCERKRVKKIIDKGD